MKEQIGQNAGRVWQYLEETGEPVTVSSLKKALKGTPESQVYTALGWLAREDKVDIYKNKRATYVRVMTG
ncbi:MAG: hypothetical protein GF307_09500 [candidate division Zixibacteria bacterium]|nr:hypothetical protein [candidate division Zixibacteria bacterium]